MSELLTRREISERLGKSIRSVNMVIFRHNITSHGTKLTGKGRAKMLYSLDELSTKFAERKIKNETGLSKPSRIIQTLEKAKCEGLMTLRELAVQCGCHLSYINKVCIANKIYPVSIRSRKGSGQCPYEYQAEDVVKAMRSIKRGWLSTRFKRSDG